MKIKVIDKNLQKIQDALDRTNGEAQKHTALPGDIFALANSRFARAACPPATARAPR